MAQSLPVQVLMPSILAVKNEYDDATPVLGDENHPLSWVLKNHILSEGGCYLLPVSILLELKAGTNLAEIRNPYWNPVSNTGWYLTDTELERLFKNSGATTVVDNAYRNFLLALKDKSSLLGHLTELVRLLRLNDAREGIGSEKNAGSGAYPAIFKFYEYYNTLPEAEKQKIPTDLEDAIDLLYSFSTDPEKNVDASTTIETCIATRREKIQKAMQGAEETLAGIALSDEDKANLVREATSEFEKTQQFLKQSLVKKQYEGQDNNLCVTKALFDELDVRFYLPENKQDLASVLRSLNDEAFKGFFEHTELADQIITGISLEEFVLLLNSLSPQKIRLLLKNSKKTLGLITAPKIFAAVLQIFDAEKCRAICEGLRGCLPQIIRHGYELCTALENLDVDKFTLVCEALKDHLPQIIKNRYQFHDALQYLNNGQRTELAVLLGREKLDTILSETICHNSMKNYRLALLKAYNEIRKSETQNYFHSKCFSFFQWSRQDKLGAADQLINEEVRVSRAAKQGLLGKINFATS